MANFPFIEVHAVDHCNNNCRWCHNYSPFSPKKEYQASDYFEGFDFLIEKEHNFQIISLMGGEPFLHSNITLFAHQFLERYRKPQIITTNGFWLSETAVKDYQDLWSMLNIVKISRYPTIEKRLGGADEFKRLVNLIKEYNPKIVIEFPDKGTFNTLEFYEEPIEVEHYCGNSGCIALLPDMKIARCGAGAYTHLAPEGMVSEAFTNNKDIIYDLRTYDIYSFNFWKHRYPLDGCSYCSFAKKNVGGAWKMEKGRTPFNTAYELEYYYSRGIQKIALRHTQEVKQEAAAMLAQYGEQPEAHMLAGLAAMQSGDANTALESFTNVLQLAPGNKEALTHIQQIRKQVSRQ